MALLEPVLEAALASAFKAALTTLTEYAQSDPTGTLIPVDQKVQAGCLAFAKIAAPAIDAYIRSATIVVPAGQVVTTPAGPGTTTSPSLPAIIS
jgi:hypothetical protein